MAAGRAGTLFIAIQCAEGCPEAASGSEEWIGALTARKLNSMFGNRLNHCMKWFWQAD